MSDHHDDLPRFNHPASTKMLFGVFFSLIALTLLTVATSALWSASGLPEAFAFPVAMIIASVKAFLVGAFFMHMWWDKSFNVVAFLCSGLFAALFIGLTLLDSTHYQESIDAYPRNQSGRQAIETVDASAAEN